MKPDNERLPDNNNEEIGGDHMAVNHQELDAVKKAQQKINKDKLRNTLIQKSIEENAELLRRLSKT